MSTAAKTLTALSLLLFSTLALAGPAQTIELTDGSVVRGEIVSLGNDIYTLKSDTLGTIEIPAAKVRTISNGQPAVAAGNVSPAATARVDTIRNSMMNDPAAMNKIQSLQSDPLVKNILDDEDTMRAINAGDLDSLMNDPKIKALMEHSTVQELTQGGL